MSFVATLKSKQQHAISRFLEFLELLMEINCALTLTMPKLQATDKIKITECENTVVDVLPKSIDLPYATSDPFRATCYLEKRHQQIAGKDIIVMSLLAPEISSKIYQPGDTIGILPENKGEDVDRILRIISNAINSEKPICLENKDEKRKYLPEFTTIRKLFTQYVNLKALPTKQMIATLAEHADENEKMKMRYLASKEGVESYKTTILDSGMKILELLENFPSCRPPAEVLVQVLPRLLPRPYSIASSPLNSPGRILIAFSVLPQNEEGVCSGQMRRALIEHTELTVYFRNSNGFRLPEDENVPLVLIGPGTGVAPFIGFLDHLSYKAIRRKVYLFTGYRTQADFLFREEIENHLVNGTLTKLFECYSRESRSPAKYVQESIRANWKEVGRALIDEEGCVYECGDFKKMTDTISEAVTTVIEKYANVSREDALLKVKQLKASKNYVQDIWS